MKSEKSIRTKSIKKNMLMSTVLTSANFVFPLITYSYVARILSPYGTGRVAFVESIISYFSYVAILGIPAYGVVEVSKVRDDKSARSEIVQELLAINMVSTLVAYVFLFIAIMLVPRLYTEKQLFIIMGLSILLSTIGMEWVYQALEEYSYITIRSLIFKTIAVILTFLLVKTEKDVVLYGFVHLFSNSAAFILNFIHIRKFVVFRKNIGCRWKRHLKPILTLFTASVIITIYNNFDITMIGIIKDANEVGLYNSALKIKTVLRALSVSMTAVLIPRIAYHLDKCEKEQALLYMKKSVNASFLLAIPAAVYVFIFPKECLLCLGGEDYIPAANTLRILGICVLPLVLTNLFGNQILIPSGKQKRYSQSVFWGLWINLVLNFLLIPGMGALGAAIGTLVTECWNVFWMSGGAKEYRASIVKEIK